MAIQSKEVATASSNKSNKSTGGLYLHNCQNGQILK